MPSWMGAQQQLAALSSNSRLVVVDDTGHIIQLNQPAVVAENIRLVVEAAQTGEPLM
jgi:pimeloyl-ACP methyl ester carboxylesterase